MRKIPRRVLAGLAGLAAITLSAPIPAHADQISAFHRLSTFPVYLNSSIDEETAAEISAITPDGTTVVYTDSPGEAVGFVDITDPSDPQPGGRVPLDGEPTSVAIVGELILVAINTSPDHVNPSGKLAILDATGHNLVQTIDLGGQPDSVAVDDLGRYAAIAIENERDEDVDDGDIPQAPTGWLSVVDLTDYSVTEVDLTGLAEVAPEDAEPEYVDINSAGQAVVSLQENNHLAIIDLATATVVSHFSAGTTTTSGVDTEDDGLIDPSGTVTAPREPDSVGWIGNELIATANEGDWVGGTRGWTIFSTDGEVVSDSGTGFEDLGISHGLYPDHRSDAAGTEPEGLTVATFDGVPYLFVAAERGNYVAVYDVTDPANPVFTQLIPTTNEPEGLATSPDHGLLVVSSELDDAEIGIRSAVQVYQWGPGEATFPYLVSDSVDGTPIGWSTLSGLSADPDHPDRLYAVTDSAFAHTRIYDIDVAQQPARITGFTTVTKKGQPIGYDAEGVFARPDGGFWLAAEGAPSNGVENLLVQLDAHGEVVEEIALPQAVADTVTDNGLEGVTAIGTGVDEVVWVAVQHPLAGEEHARLGRYEVDNGQWSWASYPLESATDGGWVGLSEITAVDADTLAVIERDNHRGPDAALKKIYTVDIASPNTSTHAVPPVVSKHEAFDALPVLAEGNGWTADKLEGLAVAGNGHVYIVTDNDFVDDATGETIFADLGEVDSVIATPGDASLPITGTSLGVIVAAAAAVTGIGAVVFGLTRHRRRRAW